MKLITKLTKDLFYFLLISLLLISLLCSCYGKNEAGNDGIDKNKTSSPAWELNDGELIIYSQAPLKNYSERERRPWQSSNVISITIKDGITHIGNNTFNGCVNLVSVSIPNTVITIGENAFKGCSGLASIVIPDGVIIIGYSAFQGCAGLRNVVLGKNVQIIGSGVFTGCPNILLITSENPLPPVTETIFQWVSLEEKLHLLSLPPRPLIRSRFHEFDESGQGISATANEMVNIEVDAFYSINKEKCRLTVPEEAIPAYKADKFWGEFFSE